MHKSKLIIICLLSITILLLLQIIYCNDKSDDNYDDNCLELLSNKELVNNPWAQPRRLVMGGIPIPANSVMDIPGYDDTEYMGLGNHDLEYDQMRSDKTDKKSLTERLTDNIQSNSSYSINSSDDNLVSEMDIEKQKAGKTVYDRSHDQVGDSNFKTFKGANHTERMDGNNPIKWNRGNDLDRYRERLQENRVDHTEDTLNLDHMDDSLNVGNSDDYDNVDMKTVGYILTETRENLRY